MPSSAGPPPFLRECSEHAAGSCRQRTQTGRNHMFCQRLRALLTLGAIFMLLTVCDFADVEGESIENTLEFTGTRVNDLRRSDSITSSTPENSFTATVTITSNDAIEPSDILAWIEASCREGGGENFIITLAQDGLTGLKGSRTVNAAFCNDAATGQRGRVTYTVVVQRLSPFAFTAVVTASGSSAFNRGLGSTGENGCFRGNFAPLHRSR